MVPDRSHPRLIHHHHHYHRNKCSLIPNLYLYEQSFFSFLFANRFLLQVIMYGGRQGPSKNKF